MYACVCVGTRLIYNWCLFRNIKKYTQQNKTLHNVVYNEEHSLNFKSALLAGLRIFWLYPMQRGKTFP